MRRVNRKRKPKHTTKGKYKYSPYPHTLTQNIVWFDYFNMGKSTKRRSYPVTDMDSMCIDANYSFKFGKVKYLNEVRYV